MQKARCRECGALIYMDGAYDDRGEYVRDYCTLTGRSIESCEDCGADLDESATAITHQGSTRL